MSDSAKRLVVNGLSLSRVVLSPVLLCVFLVDEVPFYHVVFILFVVLHLTDFFDGRLARRWGVSSKLGFLLDGLGDVSLSLFSYIAVRQITNFSAVLLYLFIFREVSGFCFLAFRANWYSLVEDTRHLTRLPYLVVFITFTSILLGSYLDTIGLVTIDTKIASYIPSLLAAVCALYWASLLYAVYQYWPQGTGSVR